MGGIIYNLFLQIAVLCVLDINEELEMKNVCVVITARPSYSRIRSALIALNEDPSINLQIILAASSISNKYGDIEKKVKEDGLDVSCKVYNLVDGEDIITTVKTTGLGLIELSEAFRSIQPDLVVTIADRYETISTAIAAAYMNIPLVHVQGGEVTGNIDEKVRHAVSKLADIHLVASEQAKERLIKMGEEQDRIYVTGCPSIDIAKDVKEEVDKYGTSFDPIEMQSGVGSAWKDHSRYIVVMLHPVTTQIASAKFQTEEVLKAVESLDCQIYWFWPNVDAGSNAVSSVIRHHRELGITKNIYFIKNLKPEDFLKLLYKSICIVGNSSVGIRECSYLGVPAVNIGDRQKGRDLGRNVIDVEEYSSDRIIDAIKKAESMPHNSDDIYGNGNAGQRIADVIKELNNISIDKKITY